eukprot:m.2602 g.2602  ORF g.2602 m.2602 type:complete len:63 (-) comp1595_c0_seq1:340-528(-)
MLVCERECDVVRVSTSSVGVFGSTRRPFSFLEELLLVLSGVGLPSSPSVSWASINRCSSLFA